MGTIPSRVWGVKRLDDSRATSLSQSVRVRRAACPEGIGVPSTGAIQPAESRYAVERVAQWIARVSPHHCVCICRGGSRKPFASQSAARFCVYGRGMPQWIGSAATAVATLVAIAALIVSIWAGRRAARKREFEILLERIDRETTKREAETRALTERIDRKAERREAETKAFMEQIDQRADKREAETRVLTEKIDREAEKREKAIRELMDRSDRKFEALQRRSDELYRQSAEVTARVLHNEGVLATASESTPARGETEAVAAQDVSAGRPRE